LSDHDETASDQIFDLKAELPAPKDEAERHLILALDQLAQKVDSLLASGHPFPEAELHHVFELKSVVMDSPQASMIFVLVLMKLGESNVQNDILTDMIDRMGFLPPFLFYKALALAKLERVPEALDWLQRLIGTGVKNYELFMLAARWKRQLKDDRGAISMMNLAIYENVKEETIPFVFMAECFERLGELEKMLECFARIEKMKGPSGMKIDLGELYERHGEMFHQVRNLRDQA
jgi:tetratricopeptide (TPR) repeat protein